MTGSFGPERLPAGWYGVRLSPLFYQDDQILIIYLIILPLLVLFAVLRRRTKRCVSLCGGGCYRVWLLSVQMPFEVGSIRSSRNYSCDLGYLRA
jgi:hypothetical protein